MQNPRESALDVLMKIDRKEELSHIAIGETLEKYQFSEKKDRALQGYARELWSAA